MSLSSYQKLPSLQISPADLLITPYLQAGAQTENGVRRFRLSNSTFPVEWLFQCSFFPKMYNRVPQTRATVITLPASGVPPQPCPLCHVEESEVQTFPLALCTHLPRIEKPEIVFTWWLESPKRNSQQDGWPNWPWNIAHNKVCPPSEIRLMKLLRAVVYR